MSKNSVFLIDTTAGIIQIDMEFKDNNGIKLRIVAPKKMKIDRYKK